jgi:antitoxin MazE
MQLTIAKWGNSLAVRLPSQLARAAHLTEGAVVQIEEVDGKLVLTPQRKRYDLAELLSTWPEDTPATELDWGKPEGLEAW